MRAGRGGRLGAAAAAVLVLAPPACAGGHPEAAPRAPARSATTTTTAQPDPSIPIGIALGSSLVGASDQRIAADLDDVAALGATWVRADLPWASVEPAAAGRDSWGFFDRLVAAAGARRLQVLPVLAYSPGWARPAGCTSEQCAPADPAPFAAFAAAAAARYAPLGIHTWEIWNEPNTREFWRPAPDPAAYVALLAATAPAMRAVDPSVRLVSGGLSPAATGDGRISQTDYLSAMCRLGAGRFVDAVGYHPYSYPVPPAYPAPWNAWAQMTATTPSFASILAACGGARPRIWITEYGAPTGGPGATATVDDFRIGHSPDHVDEQLQARMAAEALRLAVTTPAVGAFFWYSERDLGTDPGDREDFFGLRRADGTPKPAWDALRSAIVG